MRVRARDLDSGRREVVATDVADETAADQPAGSSALSFVAPIAVNQAAVTVMRGSPGRMTGRACIEIGLREVETAPRFCNRYVSESPDFSGTSNAIGNLASSDLGTALGIVDAFKLGRLHVTSVSVRVEMARGQRLAYLRGVRLPAKVRAGRRVRATLTLRHVRGRREVRRVMVRLPKDMRPGRRRLRFTGPGVDSGGGDFFGDFSILFGGSAEEGSESAGPANVERVVKRIKAARSLRRAARPRRGRRLRRRRGRAPPAAAGGRQRRERGRRRQPGRRRERRRRERRRGRRPRPAPRPTAIRGSGSRGASPSACRSWGRRPSGQRDDGR